MSRDASRENGIHSNTLNHSIRVLPVYTGYRNSTFFTYI